MVTWDGSGGECTQRSSGNKRVIQDSGVQLSLLGDSAENTTCWQWLPGELTLQCQHPGGVVKVFQISPM